MAKLYFYYSAMNAGKTTTLLQSSYNYRESGMNTLLFTPEIDDRYGSGKIVSRVGIEANAMSFSKDFDFYAFIEKRIQKKIQPDCILIDEAQFLTKKQIKSICKIVDEFDIPILCYGLRTDFLGEPFTGSRYLLAWADVLQEIKGVCHCGRKATMVLRVNEDGKPIREGQVIEIGGNEKYVSVCRKHFVLGQAQSYVDPNEFDLEKSHLKTV